MNNTIFRGSCVYSSSDTLAPILVEDVYNLIKSPISDLAQKVKQLNIIKTLDGKMYSKQKRDLPYIICARFDPPLRKTDNFVFTSHFIIDLDHISESNLTLEGVRNTLQADPRVVLMFASPSGNGLKLLFRLSASCFDHVLYSVFYKEFAHKFAQQYALSGVVDVRTSDVCRACFLNTDPQAYYNPNAEDVELDEYIETDNPFELLQSMKGSNNEDKKDDAPEPSTQPEEDEFAKIRELLKLSPVQEVKKMVYVPEQLNDLMDSLSTYIEQTGLTITSVQDISYGKKIRVAMRSKLAESNIFYGKRGFSVVSSPRTGTNPELNGLLCDLIKSYIYQTYN